MFLRASFLSVLIRQVGRRDATAGMSRCEDARKSARQPFLLASWYPIDTRWRWGRDSRWPSDGRSDLTRETISRDQRPVNGSASLPLSERSRWVSAASLWSGRSDSRALLAPGDIHQGGIRGQSGNQDVSDRLQAGTRHGSWFLGHGTAARKLFGSGRRGCTIGRSGRQNGKPLSRTYTSFAGTR
jgi:hypothetical protein